jgi:hypothetical protein
MYACLHADGNFAILAECARYISPQWEETPPKAVLIDMRGPYRLFGSAQEIAAAMTSLARISADVAIAADPGYSHVCRTWVSGDHHCSTRPRGNRSLTAAPQPVALLAGSGDDFERWGVRRFGEFAVLPAVGIASRLGKEGMQLHRLSLRNRTG